MLLLSNMFSPINSHGDKRNCSPDSNIWGEDSDSYHSYCYPQPSGMLVELLAIPNTFTATCFSSYTLEHSRKDIIEQKIGTLKITAVPQQGPKDKTKKVSILNMVSWKEAWKEKTTVPWGKSVWDHQWIKVR